MFTTQCSCRTPSANTLVQSRSISLEHWYFWSIPEDFGFVQTRTMKHTPAQLAKHIRQSLKTQPAYLNHQLNRIRIISARSTKDGALLVKVMQNDGKTAWVNVRQDHSITVFAGTAMEELLTLSK